MANTKNEHVFPNGRGWMVRREGSTKTSRLFRKRKEAVEYAGIVALHDGGSVVSHKHNGQFKGFTQGSLQTKGQTLQWDLKFETGLEGKFKVVPDFYGRTGILKSVLETPREDLQFNGTVTVNGRAVEFRNAPGMHSHFSGPRNGHSWTWVHSNSFVDEQGNEAPMVFEGLTSRTHFFGKFLTPRISAFYFLYRGREHIFNTFWSAVFSRSKLSFGNWTFRMDKQDLSFRGEAKAELKDFAGMTFEDTDGSLIYHSSSVLSDLTLHVYRQGKIESSYFSKGSATYETASRERSPYVQVLI